MKCPPTASTSLTSGSPAVSQPRKSGFSSKLGFASRSRQPVGRASTRNWLRAIGWPFTLARRV